MNGSPAASRAAVTFGDRVLAGQLREAGQALPARMDLVELVDQRLRKLVEARQRIPPGHVSRAASSPPRRPPPEVSGALSSAISNSRNLQAVFHGVTTVTRR